MCWKAIEALCTQWNCHVVGASGVDEALAQLQNHLRSPDLIITDYRLQNNETGLERLARRLSLRSRFARPRRGILWKLGLRAGNEDQPRLRVWQQSVRISSNLRPNERLSMTGSR